MIRISVDMTYPAFAALPAEQQKQVAVSIGSSYADDPHLGFQPYPLTTATTGDAAVNSKTFMVSKRRPLLFSREAFSAFGSITIDPYLASKMAQHLAFMVERGILKVTDTAGPLDLTPSQILTFAP